MTTSDISKELYESAIKVISSGLKKSKTEVDVRAEKVLEVFLNRIESINTLLRREGYTSLSGYVKTDQILVSIDQLGEKMREIEHEHGFIEKDISMTKPGEVCLRYHKANNIDAWMIRANFIPNRALNLFYKSAVMLRKYGNDLKNCKDELEKLTNPEKLQVAISSLEERIEKIEENIRALNYTD